MMARNIKIFLFYMKYSMIKYWWVTSYKFVVGIIYLKGLFPHPNVSEFHLLSYLTPLYSPYKYIIGIIGVEILGRQQLQIILWNWGFFFFFWKTNTHTQGRGKGVLTQRHTTTLLKSWNWECYYYFYGIKHCTGKLFLRILIFGGIRALTIVMRF